MAVKKSKRVAAAPSVVSAAKPATWELCVDALAPLWPLGLALAQMTVIWLGSSATGEPYEWQQYVALAFVFPTLLLAMHLGFKHVAKPKAMHLVRGAFALLGLGTLFVLTPAMPWGWLVIIGLTLTGLAAMQRPIPPAGCAQLGYHLLGWFIFVRLIWWTDLRSLLGQNLAAATALIICGATSYVMLWPQKPKGGEVLLRGLDAAACCGFAVLTLRNWPIDLHHWAFLVGPAELVRDGGHVLWDVPAQYGAFMALLLSHGPSASSWANLAGLISLADFFYALAVYSIFTSLKPTWSMRLVAFFTATAAVFFVLGNARNMLGPQEYPIVSGIRFMWPVFLTTLIFWSEVRQMGPRITAGVGTFIWLLGVLWSFESATWCSVIWLPCAFFLALRGFPNHSIWRAASTVVMLLGGTFLTALGTGLGLYFACYGHLPDAYAYVEFALAYQGGFGAELVTLQTAAWGILAIYVFSMAPLVQALATRSLRDIPLRLVASVTLLWGLSSYFVSRSLDSNVTNLLPILLVCAGVLLHVELHTPRPARAMGAMTWFLLPLMCCTLIMAFSNWPHIRQNIPSMYAGLPYFQEAGPMGPDPYLQELVDQGHIGCDERITFAGPRLPGVMPRMGCYSATGELTLMKHMHAFLPIYPAAMLAVLPEERRLIYFHRFLQHTASTSGWILTLKRLAPTDVTWVKEISEFADRELERDTVLENSLWRAVRYKVAPHAKTTELPPTG